MTRLVLLVVYALAVPASIAGKTGLMIGLLNLSVGTAIGVALIRARCRGVVSPVRIETAIHESSNSRPSKLAA